MMEPAVRRRIRLAAAVALLVIIIDQAVKIWVKTSFYLGESCPVFSWFELRFVQNNGMAFGMELGSKLFLTLFRIAVVAVLVWYVGKVCRRRRVPTGYVVVLALIAAGALGNIIDCVFYGLIFNNPMPPVVAHFTDFGQGYASLFRGLVVDMLYFPLFSFVWPEWMPWVGGSQFSFFDPVFNIADAAISVGIFLLICFYSGHLSDPEAATPAQSNDRADE